MSLFAKVLADFSGSGSSLDLSDLRQIETARAKYPDFDQVNCGGLILPDYFHDFLRVSTHKFDLYYCLGKNRSQTAALLALPPDEQLRELAAIEAQFEGASIPC